MSQLPLRVSSETAAVLHEAHNTITARFAYDRYGLYEYVRVVAGRIARVDAFHVGLLHGTNRVRYVYGHDDPVSSAYPTNGLVAWVVRHKQTYRVRYDNGAALRAESDAADAVTVPLFRRDRTGGRRIFGMLSMYCSVTDTYDDDAVHAFEWLAGLVARVLARHQEDLEALRLLPGDAPGLASSATRDPVVEYLASRVASLRRTAEHVLVGGELSLAAEHLQQVVTSCAEIQSELAEMSMRADDGPERRFLALTPAEQRVALLIADGLNNQRLAQELGISANTVKTHLKNILRKYAMDRAQVAEDVQRHLVR
ncbi:LuxR C-terminal-related transcriptional regulator [Allokutzneria albata]|uniref:Regulatory protein, luxR family n=1 Tax=Allokutzneria albata TaxID=211114 RepID=A0A1G9UBI3_ALLAB|nr:LuxR C-terminal-related transcriptional regulator [Allokutzneria albata]SDM57311.1 regulatory protein, luxR family [Allokutzneria albata]